MPLLQLVHEYIGFSSVPILIASLQKEFNPANEGGRQFLSFNIGINSGLHILHSYLFNA